MEKSDLRIPSNVLPEKLEVTIEESSDAQQNLDLDTDIALEVASGKRPPTIRLWRHTGDLGIVVSRKDIAGALGPEAISKVQEAGYQLYVRHTGGTAVPHARGVLNLSMMFPRTATSGSTDDYYRLLCKPQVDWLYTYGISATTGEVPGSYCDGRYNVIVDGQKLVGTAQSWRGGLAGMASRHPGYILAHACIMVDVDLGWGLDLINRFYEWVGDEYRVDRSTSTTLNDILKQKRDEPPLTSGQAMEGFASFLEIYFSSLGAQVARR